MCALQVPLRCTTMATWWVPHLPKLASLFADEFPITCRIWLGIARTMHVAHSMNYL